MKVLIPPDSQQLLTHCRIRMPSMKITQDQAIQIFNYDPITGILSWKETRGSRATKGERAGTLDDNGYRAVHLIHKKYWEHRLIWLLVHGEYPSDELDHINGMPSDNRLCNLRLALRGQNCFNTKIPKTNTSGFKGVCFQSGKWRARCKVRGVKYHLGYFYTPEEASMAYNSFVKVKHLEFYRDTTNPQRK